MDALQRAIMREDMHAPPQRTAERVRVLQHWFADCGQPDMGDNAI